MHCLQKGPYFKDLFGILGPYWVLIYISGSLFSLFWFHSRKECQFSLHVYNNELFWSVCDEQLPALLLYMYVVKLCFRFTLLANFHFYLCLRFNFHTSSFWVLILAAGGPSEAQKVWTFQMATFNAPKLSRWSVYIVFATKKTRKLFSRQKSVLKSFLQQKSVR